MRCTRSAHDSERLARRTTRYATLAGAALLALVSMFAATQQLRANNTAPVSQSTATPEAEATEPPAQEGEVGGATATPTRPAATATARPTSRATTQPTGASVATTTALTATNGITGTVLVHSLNLRSGPATSFKWLGAVKRNEVLAVIGATSSCAWLHVETEPGVRVWVSGDVRYVKLAGECADLPIVAVQPVATPTRSATIPATEPATLVIAATGTSTPTVTVTTAVAITTPGAASIITPAPEPTPELTANPAQEPSETPASETGFPPGTGCVRLGNYVGPELTISLTNLSTGESRQSSLPDNQTRLYCLPPARYAITVGAPPPWSAVNFELDIRLGEGIDVPLTPQ